MEETNRRILLEQLAKLPENDLVCLTSGNVSIRNPESNQIIIKPSGVPYQELTCEKLVVLNQNGEIIEGTYIPSSDTVSHVYIYQHLENINGIVHTHSPYATCFAAAGINIPVLFTETAEEFGGEVPCTDFVLIGDDSIGKQVMKFENKSQAVLLRKHGVVTYAQRVEKAVELAILVENSAKIAWMSMQIGNPEKIDGAQIQQLFSRQQNVYGQK